MKRIISLTLLLVMMLSFVACDLQPGDKYETRSRTISSYYFNTHSSVHTYADENDDNIERYVSIADEVLSYYHELFDIYFEYSGINNLKTVNKKAGKEPVKVDRELVDFLLYCKELYVLTSGKTNVMLGSVLKIWHDVREEAMGDFGYLNPDELPTEEALNEAAEHTSIDALVINEEELTVYISDPKASIDVGAIAKGYVVEILYNRLKSEGAESVVLNIGGNIRTIGSKPDGTAWISGITNPDKSSDQTLKCRIELGESSLVTSGDYERYFISADRKYHHIIDPVTLVPAEYFSSVSIITEDSGLADALSTALFCMTYEEGLALAKTIGGVDVVWIYANGDMKCTDGVKIING